MVTSRSWLVVADGYLASRYAKTAHGVLRYSQDEIVAVLDRDNSGRSVADVLPELGCDAPIVDSLEAGIARGATSLLLGVATPGGWVPDHWRRWIIDAIKGGLEVANGLHRLLAEDEDLVALARRHGARLWDVRLPPDDIALFSGRSLSVPQDTVLTVGSDCSVGKMTVSLELANAARKAGVAAEFVATGQTGILIEGRGIAVDRVIADFVPGAAERLVLEADTGSKVLLVEGQGSLWHPAYSGVTLGLLHGAAPKALVLCHQAGRRTIEESPHTALPPLRDMIDTYEDLAAIVRPAKVACIALNTKGLSDVEARAALAEVTSATGLPAGDVLRGQRDGLWDAVASALDA